MIEASLMHAVQALRSRNAPDEVIVRSLARLRRDAKQLLSKELLLEIVNDETFLAVHRRRCLLQLFSLHLTNGMSSADFNRTLVSSGCIRPEQIVATDFGSVDEKNWSWWGDTVVAINLDLPPGDTSRVFLRIEGIHDFETVQSQLTKRENSHLYIKQIIIKPSDLVDELLIRY